MSDFTYTYSAKEQNEIEKIRNKYLPKEESKKEQLIRLDKKAEQSGQAKSIAVGVMGTLILGVGMCFTMVWNTSAAMFATGVIVGLFGMLVLGAAYPLYKKVTEKERAKVAEQILALADELLI